MLLLLIGGMLCAAFRSERRFGSRSMIASSRTRSQSSASLYMATYKVTLRQEGKELAVLDVPDDKVLLDAALDAGIELPHDCKLGRLLYTSHIHR